MPRQATAAVATLGIDIGKNVFHLIGLNERGAIVLRLRLSRAVLQEGRRPANRPR
jgi:transposase